MIKIEHKSTLYHGSERSRLMSIAKIAQAHEAGTEFDNPIKGFNISANASANATILDPRLMSIVFLPTLRGFAGETQVNLAFEKMYNVLVGTAYDTTSFNKADLGKHIMICEGFLMAVDMIDRCLDNFALVEFGNIAYSDIEDVISMRLTNGALDFASVVAARNRLKPIFDKLFLPDCIPAIERRRALCRHIYCDDVHDKTQLIAFIPSSIYTVLDNNNDVDVNTYWSPRSTSIHDILNFISSIEHDMDVYVKSSFYKDISPYLYRAMVDPNGPKVCKYYILSDYDAIKPKVDGTFIYDIEVLQLIRNADFVGYVGNYNNNHAGSPEALTLTEDNSGNLRQGILSMTSSTTTTGLLVVPTVIYWTGTSIPAGGQADSIDSIDLFKTGSTQIVGGYIPVNSSRKYYNLEDWPTPEDTLYVALAGSVLTTKPNASANNAWRLVGVCGDALFEVMRIFYRNPGAVVNTYVTCIPSIVWDASSPSLPVSVSSFATLTHGGFIRKTFLDAFSCSPVTSYVTFTQYDNMDQKYSINDVDNLVEIPYSSIVAYHTYDAFDEFTFNSAGFETASANLSTGSGNNNRRFKKHKRTKSATKDSNLKGSKTK